MHGELRGLRMKEAGHGENCGQNKGESEEEFCAIDCHGESPSAPNSSTRKPLLKRINIKFP